MDIIPKRDAGRVPFFMKVLLFLAVIVLTGVIGTIAAAALDSYWQSVKRIPLIGNFTVQFSVDREFFSAVVTAFIAHAFHTVYGALRRL